MLRPGDFLRGGHGGESEQRAETHADSILHRRLRDERTL
jgi:hypothetical protein